jgi:hypothetical protein
MIGHSGDSDAELSSTGAAVGLIRQEIHAIRDAGAVFRSITWSPKCEIGGSKIQKIRPRDLAVPGPNLGVGVRHALFPDGTRLGALAFAGCVLPDATLRGRRMSRSHGGTVLAVTGRDLLSEASSPSSVAPCRERRAGRGADTSAILLRVGTLTTGTAPACGWPLALRYGSDLLPLRLRSALQCGGVVLHAAPLRRLTGLAGPAHSALPCRPCAPCSRLRTGPSGGGGPAGKHDCVLVSTVATITLWGNCVGARIETVRGPDSAQSRFLIAPRRSAPTSWVD